MKKLILSVVAAVFVISSFAQDGAKAKKTPEAIANKRADQLKSELALSDDQRSQIYTIVLDHTNKVRAVHARYPNDKKAAKAELKPLREACDASIKSVLTAEQVTKWEKMKADKKAAHQGKKKKNKPESSGQKDQ